MQIQWYNPEGKVEGKRVLVRMKTEQTTSVLLEGCVRTPPLWETAQEFLGTLASPRCSGSSAAASTHVCTMHHYGRRSPRKNKLWTIIQPQKKKKKRRWLCYSRDRGRGITGLLAWMSMSDLFSHKKSKK